MASEIKLKFFSERDFERCFPVCFITDMDIQFLLKLDSAREYAGLPFILNCAYRSPSWDKSRGRSGEGYHTKGRAVDVRCCDGESRRKIIEACLHFGLSVGVYRSFLHIDDRENPIIFWSN